MARFGRILLPLAVLLLGAGVFVLLARTKPEPEKRATERTARLVEVSVLAPASVRVKVEAHGTVVPSRQVIVQPEVTGRVIWQSKELLPGGRVVSGEPLLKLDAREYRLAHQQQAANVDRAELELRMERSRKIIASDEWRILSPGDDATEEGRALALREPHLETAEAGVAAAKSARERARLLVDKTVVVAPFDAFVQSENVELGQLVGPQSALATLVGTETFWVQVSLRLDELAALAVPGYSARVGEGAEATVAHRAGAETVERRGRVIRLLGDLDPVGRMARVLVSIDDPFSLRTAARGDDADRPPDATLPLLVGAYVDVTLFGREIEGVFRVPRAALRDGTKLFLVGEGSRLTVVDADVVWREREVVFVKNLREGAQLITSALPGAVPGMPIRTAGAAGDDGAARR